MQLESGSGSSSSIVVIWVVLEGCQHWSNKVNIPDNLKMLDKCQYQQVGKPRAAFHGGVLSSSGGVNVVQQSFGQGSGYSTAALHLRKNVGCCYYCCFEAPASTLAIYGNCQFSFIKLHDVSHCCSMLYEDVILIVPSAGVLVKCGQVFLMFRLRVFVVTSARYDEHTTLGGSIVCFLIFSTKSLREVVAVIFVCQSVIR